MCSRDCEALERRLDRFTTVWGEGIGRPQEIVRWARASRLRKWMRRLGIQPGRSFWEADHVVPVVEGGGGCRLENLRTLCVPCHKRVTRALAARRAEARRQVKQLPLFEGSR
jgi:5-methylcytosine-specific restriction endonuclease McrA